MCARSACSSGPGRVSNSERPSSLHRAGVGPVERQRDPGERRLARSRFADDAERAAGEDREADAVERRADGVRGERTRPVQAVGLEEVDDVEQRRAAHARWPDFGVARQQRETCAVAEGDRRRGGRAADVDRQRRSGRRTGSRRRPRDDAAASREWSSAAAPRGAPGSRPRLEQRAGVGVARLARARRRPAPLSRIRPPYITITRSQWPATTARSWLTRISAIRDSARKPVDQRENPRLHGDVERRGRLVGDDQPRRAADRHGDHRALPLAARQPERIGARRALGIGEPDMSEQAHRFGARRPSGSGRDAGRAARRPARRRGAAGSARSSAPGTSWRSGRRAARASPPRPSRRVRAPRSGSSRRRSAPSGARPISASAVIVLPEPDSPTTPRLSPSSRRKVAPLTIRTSRRRTGRSTTRSFDFEQHVRTAP